MENNENMNNQVNENNVQEEKKNNNKTIGMVILVIGLLLLCFAGYKLFIEKPESNKTKDDNTQNNGNNSTNSDEIIYKTKDGKKMIKVSKNNDEEYLVKYNGDDLNSYIVEHGKYSIFVCGEFDTVYSFVVNNKTNELVDLEYGDSSSYYIINIGEYYFFLSTNKTYDENLNIVADSFIISNEKDAFYAMKNGYVNKYDVHGKIVKSGNVKIDNDNGIRLSYPRIYKDNVYSLVEVNKKAYLYDFINDKKYEIENPYKIRVCPDLDGFECGRHISMDLVGDKLFIQMAPTDKAEWQPDYEDIVYLFDIKSSKLSKDGKYLTSDYSLSSEKTKKGYFYIGNNENVFKYDYDGNVVEKSDFNIKNVYKTLDGRYGVSSYFGYDGKLYYLVKEDSKIYLQNAFSKDKTEIVDLDKYVLLGVRYYTGKGTYAENTGKIEIILVDKSKDATKAENEIYYYFDMNNNTLTK